MFLAKAKQFQKSVDYIDKKIEGQGRPTTLAFFASWPSFLNFSLRRNKLKKNCSMVHCEKKIGDVLIVS